jgi:hypothetical protein
MKIITPILIGGITCLKLADKNPLSPKPLRIEDLNENKKTEHIEDYPSAARLSE